MFKLIIIIAISCSSCTNRQSIKLLYSSLDNNDCNVELEISKDYESLVSEQLGNNSLKITKQYLYANDTLFTLIAPDTLSLSSIFITSEFLQIKKTPVPDSLSNYIIRQHNYNKREIQNIKISQMTTKENLLVSKLSFKISENNKHMVNYSFFVKNRSVTVGLLNEDYNELSEFDKNIMNLKIKCP